MMALVVAVEVSEKFMDEFRDGGGGGDGSSLSLIETWFGILFLIKEHQKREN